MNFNNYDKLGLELLQAYKNCDDRDGSQAFDSLTSIHQYYPLYALSEFHLKLGAQVLDWGAGSGHFTYFLMKNGYIPTTYAFNKPGLLIDRIKDGTLNFVLGNSAESTQLPFVSSTFDAVYSVGVLEHVREFDGTEEGSLLEIYRVLKEGGLFFCYHFPNKFSWIEYLARHTGVWSHYYLYSKSDIDKLFSEQKWEIVERKRYAVLPRNVLGKILPERLKKSRKIAIAFDLIDNILSLIFRPFAQNWLIIVRKKQIST